MEVDEDTVRRIARLARIKVTDAEAKALEGSSPASSIGSSNSTRSTPPASSR